ncbi:MAG: helix-turn-helix domain-containing protein [Terriglobia bacterium]|jgi:cytoskeleton protein RodZ
MSAFGENLRREREMRGVSLEEISSATKISLRFLDAIEREDFAKLPGGIFSRSFVRSYARYLGLDDERVVAEFQLAARPQTDFDLHRMAAGNTTSGRPGSRTPLIATGVAVVLLVGSYMLFRYSQRALEAPAPSPPPVVVAPKPAPPPPQPAPLASGNAAALPGVNPATSEVTPSAPTAPAAPSSPQHGPAAGVNPAAPTTPQTAVPAATKPAADGDLVLQLAATDRAWVAVDADGKTVLQRVLNPNEVETLKAHKSFDVTTGNAQAVILTLNGETLKPLGRHGEVKSVHLTRDDLKNSTP